MTPLEIENGIKNANIEWHEEIKRYREYLNDMAFIQRDYDVEYQNELVRLKEEGIPATLIRDMAKGNIADLGLKLELASIKVQVSSKLIRQLESKVSSYQTIAKQNIQEMKL